MLVVVEVDGGADVDVEVDGTVVLVLVVGGSVVDEVDGSVVVVVEVVLVVVDSTVDDVVVTTVVVVVEVVDVTVVVDVVVVLVTVVVLVEVVDVSVVLDELVVVLVDVVDVEARLVEVVLQARGLQASAHDTATPHESAGGNGSSHLSPNAGRHVTTPRLLVLRQSTYPGRPQRELTSARLISFWQALGTRAAPSARASSFNTGRAHRLKRLALADPSQGHSTSMAARSCSTAAGSGHAESVSQRNAAHAPGTTARNTAGSAAVHARRAPMRPRVPAGPGTFQAAARLGSIGGQSTDLTGRRAPGRSGSSAAAGDRRRSSARPHRRAASRRRSTRASTP